MSQYVNEGTDNKKVVEQKIEIKNKYIKHENFPGWENTLIL